MALDAHPSLVGRAPELRALHAALDSAPRSGTALLLRGDPGVGKTALLSVAAQVADQRGWRVLRTDGTPAEQRLPLAGVHKLLRPVLDHGDDDVAPAGGNVLAGAFRRIGDDLDVFRLALACLDLVSDLAAATPVLLLVDDAHWLDRTSGEVLAFVARRLQADRVVLVVAARDVEDHPLTEAGLPEIDVGPLDSASAAALLDGSAPDLAPDVRRAVLETAAGNALALLELPWSMTDAAAGPLPAGGLVLSRRLERGFSGRSRDVPAATRDLLLVGALDDSDDLAEIVAAAAVLAGHDRDVDDLAPAVTRGLVRPSRSVLVFRHPLVRSAVRQDESAGRRRAAHAALASVVADQPDRCAWHRAHAVTGHDDAVAAELDEVATRAQRGGSVAEALAALERAAELTSTGDERGSRLLRAAELACDAGRAAEGRRYLDAARSSVGAAQQLRLEAVQELTDEAMLGGAARVQALVQLADRAREQGDEELALRFLLRAAMRCWHVDVGPEAERAVVVSADRIQLARDDPRRLVIYAYAAPFDSAGDVLEALADRPPRTDDEAADLLMYGYAGACIGAYREAEAYCSAAAQALRQQGRLRPLAEALSLLTWSALRRTRWHIAVPAAEECVRVSRDIRHPVPEAAGLAALAAIAGIRGDVDTAEAMAAQAEQLARRTHNTIGRDVTHLARGITAEGQGRPDDAFTQLWHLFAPHDPARQRMQACRTISHLADAAARSGRAATARVELSHLETLVSTSRAPGVQVAMRTARAVLSDPEHAEDLFRTALDADWDDWAFEHGRLLLSHGAWLRRRQRAREARAALELALEEFTRTGALPWAEQARRELRAAGTAQPTDSAPRDDAWQQLSPQEARIAALVVEGLSNKDIGHRLRLSPRTVGSHLYRIFPKLGVASRTQLVRRLSPSTTAALDPPGRSAPVGPHVR